MKTSNLLIAVLATMTMGVAGCQEYQPKSDGDNSGQSLANVDLTEVNKAADEADVSLEELEAELDDINIGWLGAVSTASDGGVAAQGIFDNGIGDRIVEVLDRVVVKFEDLVGKLRGKLDDVRAKIQDKMAQLDPTNPAHIAAMAQLQKLLAEVDEIEGRVDEALDRLAEKVGSLTERIDDVIDGLDMGNPLHWIALAELNKVKIYLGEVQERLALL